MSLSSSYLTLLPFGISMTTLRILGTSCPGDRSCQGCEADPLGIVSYQCFLNAGDLITLRLHCNRNCCTALTSSSDTHGCTDRLLQFWSAVLEEGGHCSKSNMPSTVTVASVQLAGVVTSAVFTWCVAEHLFQEVCTHGQHKELF